MPRKAKGPRLYLRRGHGAGWVILDQGSERRTGCSEHQLAEAERELALYIAEKYQPRRAAGSLDKILIADVVSVYLRERGPHTKNPSFIAATAEPILAWWGTRTLADIRGQTCRDYVLWRTSQRIRRRKQARKVSESTARHDLKTLRAAIKFFHAEYGPLPSEPKVTLPAAAAVRAVVTNGSVVHADEATHWDALHARLETRRINHSEAYSKDGACTNQAESFLARLRRMVDGQHHHVSPQYLHQYAVHAAWAEDHRREDNGRLCHSALSLALLHPTSTSWKGYWQR